LNLLSNTCGLHIGSGCGDPSSGSECWICIALCALINIHAIYGLLLHSRSFAESDFNFNNYTEKRSYNIKGKSESNFISAKIVQDAKHSLTIYPYFSD
jgi:hypothetical protein